MHTYTVHLQNFNRKLLLAWRNIIHLQIKRMTLLKIGCKQYDRLWGKNCCLAASIRMDFNGGNNSPTLHHSCGHLWN